MRTDSTSCKSVARLAQTILQALNPSYAEHSLAATIDRGVLNSATWGRSPVAIRGLILRNLYQAAEKSKIRWQNITRTELVSRSWLA